MYTYKIRLQKGKGINSNAGKAKAFFSSLDANLEC